MITMSMIKNKYVNYTSKEQDCQDCRSANGAPTIRQVRGKQLSPVDGHILSHKSLESEGFGSWGNCYKYNLASADIIKNYLWPLKGQELQKYLVR